VRDVHGHARLAPDPDRLGNRAQKADRVRTLVTKMRIIDAAARRCLTGEADDFIGGGVALGRIVKPRTEPERPALHGRHDKLAHALELSGVGRRAARAQHAAANRTEAHEQRDVGADVESFEPGELRTNVDRTPSIISRDNRGHALHQ
jgi:hypothetical protein